MTAEFQAELILAYDDKPTLWRLRVFEMEANFETPPDVHHSDEQVHVLVFLRVPVRVTVYIFVSL